MKPDVTDLLDELVLRHARGEPLAVEDLLRRAGPRAEELAPLIDRFLERAPRRASSEDALAFVRSLDDPPLLRARVQRALRVDDVVDAIVSGCAVRPDARGKVRRYYQQLEAGLLDPSRVATVVWDAITTLLGRPLAALVDLPAGPTKQLSVTYHRADKLFDPSELPVLASPSAAEPEPLDEVDALFLGSD